MYVAILRLHALGTPRWLGSRSDCSTAHSGHPGLAGPRHVMGTFFTIHSPFWDLRHPPWDYEMARVMSSSFTSPLNYAALHYTALHCTALHYTTVQQQ